MSREWQRIRAQWEKARITDAQFISQSEAMGAHDGALAREMVRRDFGETRRSLGHVEPVIGLDHN
ncbi:MAG TPA: hypothetical protein VFP79_05555 [Pseudolabrys sp.]|nr:hypothetical protein [Pseudolabrys sp.]